MNRKRVQEQRGAQPNPLQRTHAEDVPPAPIGLLLSRRSIGIGIGILVLASMLALSGLSNHLFWDDEANTALFARQLRTTGHLSGFDGTNVIGFREGAELDENLRNTYFPPVQYGVAALGQKLFGDTTFGNRILFTLAGLAALWLVLLWSHWHLGGRLPAWLPLLILALSPAYLLYIRQCRYYSLIMLFTMALLALAAAPVARRRALVPISALSALCMGLLLFTHYMAAVAAGACLTLLWALPRYRTRTYAAVYGAAMAAALGSGIFVLLTANPYAHAIPVQGSITGIARTGILAWRYVTGLSTFEMFPLVVPLLLVLLRRSKPAQQFRGLIDEALFICLLMLAYLGVAILFAPTGLFSRNDLAEMRYVAPVIAIGSLASAVLLFVAWRLSKTAGIVLVAIFILTNALHLGLQPIRPTLALYMQDALHRYDNGTDHLVRYLSTLPDGTSVQVMPDNMVYPAMYYLPRLHYVNQLAQDKRIAPALRATLPAYVFTRAVQPDCIVIRGDQSQRRVQSILDERFGEGAYAYKERLAGDWNDRSRPEIAWHTFGPVEEKAARGFWVYARQAVPR